MSMLAEPRRKLKWSVDPRNSTWSKDDSKFGQKMLERMGWSKGKGLGKSEQGATEHIKVKVKNNSLGLGTANNHEDNWIAHQDDFNQLLAELNNCHGQNNTEEPATEQTQGFSLEEKSKTSKKRVHYMKFTKGKDLSSRSETDLACIFGKRAKQMRNQDETSNGTDSQEEKEQGSDDKDGPSNPEVEVNTVTSALTMQEYFAQRMAQLKKGRAENQSSASTPETNSNSQSQSTDDSPSTSDMEESRKRKKKKKKDRKDDQHGDERTVEENEESQVTVEEQADPDGKKKKKKKKERRAREEDPVDECCVPAANQDTPGDIVEHSTRKKKKRKNKETPTHTPTDSTNEDDNISDADISDKKRKKRKQREHEEEQTEVVEGKKFKKDKKKKKNDN
ncbi:hypothetical protein KOW79_020173 [Hemibagrus wyckioides]|uniref:G-patch domain-containing protein n=1 Tax=Hemibagrus wyckioides TaxID=337641 RepID=A0A9D3N6K0_9TELE|nr:PIN2/TERF1-interacting telomerase inhibitor 1 [Hemibagrus wyckioides]KAG7316632.1 hypothetical protein KOW79_020173 [Hemibagrus wyckioides]